MNHDAVLFDLDGTLLDTIEDLADSMNAVLARRGHPGHSVDAYRYFVGAGVELLVKRALPPARRDAETIASGVAEMREEYGRRWHAKTRPYEGVPEMLVGLHDRGLPVAVLSNKPDDSTTAAVRYFFPDIPFADIRGAREGVPKKPDPAAALDLAEGLGVAAARVLYVGDTDIDMETAVAAGMEPAGALWGFRDEAELRDHGAAHLVERPLDLLAIV